MLLTSVPLGVFTLTVPLAALLGTLAVISELDTTVKVAGVPLKLTAVAPFRFVPRVATVLPAAPEVGCVSTKGLRPTDSLSIIPIPDLAVP